MKKTAWLYKVLVFVFIIISIYAFFRMSFIISENKIKNEIIESVNNSLDDFNSYSMKMMNEKTSSGEFKSFKVQRDPDYPDIINYFYKGKGKGIGSGTIYYGLYFVPDDDVDISFNGLLEKKDSDTWFYQEKNSDNTMYLERINKSYYYYKTTY